MSQTNRKWLLRLVKLAVCAAALWYLSDKVSLQDRVRLRDEPQVRYILVQQTGKQLTLEHPDSRQTVPALLDQLADEQQLPPGQYPIEPGLKTVIREANGGWLVLALLAMGPWTFILAWRLWLLLITQSIRIPFRDTALLTFAGNFFNFTLPGTTGGDFYKAFHIARQTPKRTEAVTIILLDRAVGLAMFIVLAAVTIFASWDTELIGAYGRLVGYLLAATLIGAGLFFSRRVRRWLQYERLIARLPLADKIRRMDETVFSFRYYPWHSAVAVVLTLVSHLLIVLSVYYLARAFGVSPVDVQRTGGQLFTASLLSVCVGFVIAMIPISPAGFGLMEAVFYKVLVAGGWCSTSQMLAITLGVRLVQIAWSLPGVIVPWLGFQRPQAIEAQSKAAVEM